MEMFIISKLEDLFSKPVSAATPSQANDFFLWSLKSTEVLLYKADISLLLDLIFLQTLSKFYFTSCSVILYFT